MFNTWKRGTAKAREVADESDIALLRETLAYLQGRSAPEVADAPPRAEAARLKPPVVAPEQPDEALATAQRFITEQRAIAEALLREVCALEQRLEIQAKAARAARVFAAAQQKAHEATSVAQEAADQAAAALANHTAAVLERKNADELVAAVRRMLAEVSAKLERSEAHAEGCAAAETQTEAEAAYAAQRVAEAQTARERALQEAQVAREEAAALKSDAAAAAPSVAGIGEVQQLAKRIAEAAAALTPESPAGWN